MTQPMRWGILSTAHIAPRFISAVANLDDAEIVAVGSRRQETADAFADEHKIPRRHASYEALAADPEVDAIYIATPHMFHKDNALLCLGHGKHVLCEKPLCLNGQQACEMAAAARDKGLFLMEAMWARFTPLMRRLDEMLREGAIGDVVMVESDLGFRLSDDPLPRLVEPELAGGALLDVGVYTIAFTFMVLGKPDRITSTMHFGAKGTDDHTVALFEYDSGAVAINKASMRTFLPQYAYVYGTKGRIYIESRCFGGTVMTLQRPECDDERIEVPMNGFNGFEYQIIEAQKCIREGRTESEILPLDESIAIADTMDTVREQQGFKYPGE